jgi:hypothetical protein
MDTEECEKDAKPAEDLAVEHSLCKTIQNILESLLFRHRALVLGARTLKSILLTSAPSWETLSQLISFQSLKMQ